MSVCSATSKLKWQVNYSHYKVYINHICYNSISYRGSLKAVWSPIQGRWRLYDLLYRVIEGYMISYTGSLKAIWSPIQRHWKLYDLLYSVIEGCMISYTVSLKAIWSPIEHHWRLYDLLYSIIEGCMISYTGSLKAVWSPIQHHWRLYDLLYSVIEVMCSSGFDWLSVLWIDALLNHRLNHSWTLLKFCVLKPRYVNTSKHWRLSFIPHPKIPVVLTSKFNETVYYWTSWWWFKFIVFNLEMFLIYLSKLVFFKRITSTVS